MNRKARKDHQCDTCGRTIKNGETYVYYKGFDPCDGLWEVKKHQSCDAFANYIMDRYRKEIETDGIVYDTFDYVCDDHDPIIRDAWNKIRTGAASWDDIKNILPSGGCPA